MKLKTIKDLRADERVDDLYREYGFAGEDQYGWWCHLKEGWMCADNKCSTINEKTISSICDKVNYAIKIKL